MRNDRQTSVRVHDGGCSCTWEERIAYVYVVICDRQNPFILLLRGEKSRSIYSTFTEERRSQGKGCLQCSAFGTFNNGQRSKGAMRG